MQKEQRNDMSPPGLEATDEQSIRVGHLEGEAWECNEVNRRNGDAICDRALSHWLAREVCHG